MQVPVSKEVNEILDSAAVLSARRRQYFVGVEHLFEVLVEKHPLLPARFAASALGALQQAGSETARRAWHGSMPMVGTDVFYTPRTAALTTDAAKLAERLTGSKPTAAHLLLAILADAHALPSRVMDDIGIDRGQMLESLRMELRRDTTKHHAGPPPRPAPESMETETTAARAREHQRGDETHDGTGRRSGLGMLTRDLTAAARMGEIEPTIGRKREMFDLLQILTRKTKNNAILVGEAGVGKTKIVEGLALVGIEGGLGGVLSDFRILELNVGSLTSGTQYRGAFEERVLALLEELRAARDVILFIDEIHLIMGAGATDGDSMDLANLLKPALARGDFRCIGATTLREYRRFIEKDPAIERRFQLVRVEPLSESATYRVLRELRPSLERHHGVTIDRKALYGAIKLTQRYMPNRQLPDKAIDVLDQACARYRLKTIAARGAANGSPTGISRAGDMVTLHDVRKVISRLTSIPLEEITAEERRHLANLERSLNRRIIGQDEAVKRVATAVRKSRAGLSDPNRPEAVMLFLGPSGVGKTELAKALADTLFGSTSHLQTFDMSEFVEESSVARLLGAAPGYVGYEEEGRLIAAVRNTPFSILLFDEIEKAHPRVFDVLLPVLDEGRLKDARHAEVSFRNCIIIMTSNIGAGSIERGESTNGRGVLVEHLREHFRPEFINRIDEIVPFHPLLFEDVREILRLAMKRLRTRLKEKELRLHVYQGSYELLAEAGCSAEFGARELHRAVDRLVTAPISSLVLEGNYSAGDIIEVMAVDGAVTVRISPGQPNKVSSP